MTIPADSQHLGLGSQIKVGWGGGKVGHGLAVLAGFAGPMSPPTKKNPLHCNLTLKGLGIENNSRQFGANSVF